MRLIQNEYAGQPWRMVVACILLNLTRGSQVREVLGPLFDRYPDPQSMARAEPEGLMPIIGKLGLGLVRSGRIVRLSKDWVSHGEPASSIALLEYHGAGQYAADSWRIFVEGDLDFEPDDKELKAYVNQQGL